MTLETSSSSLLLLLLSVLLQICVVGCKPETCLILEESFPKAPHFEISLPSMEGDIEQAVCSARLTNHDIHCATFIPCNYLV